MARLGKNRCDGSPLGPDPARLAVGRGLPGGQRRAGEETAAVGFGLHAAGAAPARRGLPPRVSGLSGPCAAVAAEQEVASGSWGWGDPGVVAFPGREASGGASAWPGASGRLPLPSHRA